jgi:hypothetical protein
MPTSPSVLIRPLLAIVAICAAAGQLHAQSVTSKRTPPFESGTYQIGGSLSWSRNDNAAGTPHTSRLTVAPSVSYFVITRLAIGVATDIERAATGRNNSRILAAGPTAAYYFGSAGGSLFPYISGSARFASNRNDVDVNARRVRTSQNLAVWTGNIGVLGMLSRQVGVFGEAYAQRQSGSDEIRNLVSGAVRSDLLDRNAYGVRFGVRSFVF